MSLVWGTEEKQPAGVTHARQCLKDRVSVYRKGCMSGAFRGAPRVVLLLPRSRVLELLQAPGASLTVAVGWEGTSGPQGGPLDSAARPGPHSRRGDTLVGTAGQPLGSGLSSQASAGAGPALGSTPPPALTPGRPVWDQPPRQ